MAVDVLMPRLSDSMEEGVVLRWLKQPGEAIATGEELVEIETDKANMVYEADVEGTLAEILAEEGRSLPVGAVIARVAGAAEPPPAVPAPVKASPTARRLARDLDVDLAAITGSGPGGRIVKADVEAAASAGGGAERADGSPAASVEPPPVETSKGRVEVVEPTRLQATVARRMAESKGTAPHFYLRVEVDMGPVMEARARLAASGDDPPPSVNDIVVKACAIALREFPHVNGAYRDGRFELYGRVNVGIAVAAEERLVVPTLFDVDRKGLRQIAVESRQLAGKVRDRSVSPPELSGATFTVTNLGMFGVTSFEGVISPPQAAILAVGEVAEKPVARGGQVTVGSSMWATLSCDHRILNGADGARFLGRVRALLENLLALSL
jgi:pyruvate dehydrogenase E2 component (dihydrolipoamide acetyltransferase)